MIDEADVWRLAGLMAPLTSGQQRLVAAVADGLRAGWLEAGEWLRCWRGYDLNDDHVVHDARTWLARRQLRHGGADHTA